MMISPKCYRYFVGFLWFISATLFASEHRIFNLVHKQSIEFPANINDTFYSKFIPIEALAFDGGTKVHLVRYQLENSSPNELSIVIAHRALIEDVRVYVKRADGKIEEFRSGMSVPVDQRQVRHKDYIFKFVLNPHERLEVISAAKSSFAFNLTPDVSTLEEFTSSRDEHMMFLYIGSVAIIGFLSIVLFAYRRESIFLYLLFTIVSTHLLGVLTPYGFINLYLFSNSPELAIKSVTIVLCMMTISSLLFCQRLLETKKFSKKVDKVASSILIINVILILAVVTSSHPIIPKIADFVCALAMLLGFIYAFISIRTNKMAAWCYLLGLSCLIAGGATFMFQDNGVIGNNEFTRHALMIGSFLECAFILIAIADSMFKVTKELDRHKGRLSYALESGKRVSFMSLTNTENRAETKSMRVSIMFIDTVEFSTTMEKFEDHIQVVNKLRENFFRIRKKIESHNGIIVDTGGDSVFAVFGFDHLSSEHVESHPADALACAKEIREMTMRHIESVTDSSTPLFPVRIGLHLDEVVVTDLGNDGQADITALGASVNFAKRLETAASTMEILVSKAFKDTILKDEPNAEFFKKSIEIKNKRNLEVAWEYNSNLERSDVERLERVITLIHQYLQKNQASERKNILALGMSALTDRAKFRIVDFSKFGLQLESKDFFPSAGIKIRITDLLDEDGDVVYLMAEHRLKIVGTVRWSKRVGDVFRIGISIDDDFLSDADILMSALEEVRNQSKKHLTLLSAG